MILTLMNNAPTDPNAIKTVLTWVILAAVAFAVIALIVKTAFVLRNAKNTKEKARAEKQNSSNAVFDYDLEMETRDGCFVAAPNVVYTVGLGFQLKAGVYELRSPDEGQTVSEIKINGSVKSYADGDVIILAAGDTVCAVTEEVLICPREE